MASCLCWCATVYKQWLVRIRTKLNSMQEYVTHKKTGPLKDYFFTFDFYFLDPLMEPYPHQFATALFSFLYHLASYDAGGEALVSCGMMEALLKVYPHPNTLSILVFFTENVSLPFFIFYFVGDKIPWRWAGPDHLCDTSSAGRGPHHQPWYGCLSVPQRPFHFHLQARGRLCTSVFFSSWQSATQSLEPLESLTLLYITFSYVAWGGPVEERVPFCHQAKDPEA